MSNDVVNVAIIDQDVTEPAVNMGDVCSRKTVDVFCAWVVFFFLFLFYSSLQCTTSCNERKENGLLCFLLCM